jgi:hypothetical protein
MRLFFFLLVFANLLFFAWTQGYFGAADESHEAQRLEQQLQADKVQIVRNAQAPAPIRADTVCRVISGLNLDNAEALKAAVVASGGEAKVLPQEEPKLYLVVIGDLAGKAAADRKAVELTGLGVEGHSAVALENGRYEIVLGRFPTEAAAREFVQGLTQRGIKSARVDGREQQALKARVEARAPAAKLLQQLPKLVAPYADAIIGECAP